MYSDPSTHLLELNSLRQERLTLWREIIQLISDKNDLLLKIRNLQTECIELKNENIDILVKYIDVLKDYTDHLVQDRASNIYTTLQ